jgi:hypothetical protein
MLTHYTALDIVWHKSLCKVQKYLNPTKSYTKTYAPVKSSKPLSTTDRVKKSKVPILIPQYAPRLHRSHDQLDDLCSYLHVLKNSIDSTVNSVTSDDLPIILDFLLLHHSHQRPFRFYS